MTSPTASLDQALAGWYRTPQAALSESTLKCFLDALCSAHQIEAKYILHAATRSASETQAVLPPGCLVQKTITGKFADTLVIWTGVTDFHLPRFALRQAAQRLGLTGRAARRHTLNPPEIQTWRFFQREEGTVTPFLLPETPALSQLTAIYHLPWPESWNRQFEVAISLSLTESLVIPLASLWTVLRSYAEQIYPHLPLTSISDMDP